MFNQRKFPPIDNNLPQQPFATRSFELVDDRTQIDQLRQMISDLQTRVAKLENA